MVGLLLLGLRLVLGLWKKGSLVERKRNEQEDITEEGILEAFRKESKMLEDGGINGKEYTVSFICPS